MIEIRHLNKSFGKQNVLKDINLKFPRYGIVSIYGPSGCGKTTLLNILSSLCDFEGDVIFDGKYYNLMNEKDKDELRNFKLGFIFQDYKLFEMETVKNNLLLALDIKSDDKRETKERKISDLLQIVGLSAKENETVSNLSGGEKQRIAIARAIINSPKVVLADEPTGNLDELNSVQIMELLQKVAKKSLVILVSHDYQLVKSYSDEIIFLKDGQVEKIKYNHHNKHIDRLPLVRINPKEKKAKLPLLFCFKHAFRGISKRKWRTLFILLTTSLGLFGVGLGALLTETISTNLYKSYSSIIDTNKVIVERKPSDETISNKVEALSYEEVMELKNKYHKDIKDVGVYYWNDFETMFTSYSFSLDIDGQNKSLPSFTLRSINEYDELDNIYNPQPQVVDNLSMDEAVIAIDTLTLNEICYQLRITKNAKSLSEYMMNNPLRLKVDIININWDYETSFTLDIKAFTLARFNTFFHSHKEWNKYIFEGLCHLPTTDKITGYSKNPWDLKKSYYLEFEDNRDTFLEEIRFDRKYQYVVGEILDDKYYPNLFRNVETSDCNRVCLLSKENKDLIPGFLSPFIKDSSAHINSTIFGSSYSYAIYPDNLMMGFARETYVTSSLNKAEDIIDLTTYLKYEESMNMVVPEDVAEGLFAKPSSTALTFNPDYTLLAGNDPLNYQEIVISRGLMNKLQIETPLKNKIYLSFPIKEELLPNGYLLRKYKTVPLMIIGVSDSERLEMSHSEWWTIMFFQTMLGVSSFDLSINSFALTIDENHEEEVIKIINTYFPKYQATSPIQNVKSSVDTICTYIEKVLTILSISSVIIASILLSLCNHLHYMEIKKDIGLIRCLGIGKSQSSKMIYSHSILMVVLSMIFATFELFLTCLVLSKAFEKILAVESQLIFNPLSLIYMLLVAILITLISSLIIKRRINKLNPLDCLY